MSTVTVALKNSSDQIIKVDIATANFSKYLTSNSIENVTLNIGQTYNISLLKGRQTQRTNYTPNADGVTLDVERYFL